MKKKLIVLIILGIFIIATTCGCIDNTENTEMKIGPDNNLNMTFLGTYKNYKLYGDIHIYHDEDRNVTCYCYEEFRGTGISCIPDKDIGK